MHAPKFTLRGIFAATAFVAVCAALWVADDSWPSGLLVLLAMIIVPTAFARGAATSRGAWRAFFIGALAVMLLAAIPQTTNIFHAAASLYVPPRGPYSAAVTLPTLLGMISNQKRGVVALWGVAVLSGIIAQIVHAVVRDQTQAKKSRSDRDWRSLTAAALRGSGKQPTVGPQLTEKTRRQIRGVVVEIALLAKQDISAAEFYGAFLDRVVYCLAASGGAVWTVDGAGGLKLACQLNLPEALRDERHRGFQRHAALLRERLSAGEGALVPPPRDEGDSGQPGNPTDCLLVLGVLRVDREPKGVVEIFQRVGTSSTTQRGYLQFVGQMCELANDYLKRHP